MAEIRVEPKRKTPIWPWIVGIIILLGLIWLLVEAFSNNEPEYQEEWREQIDEAEVEDEGVHLHSDEKNQFLVLNIYRNTAAEAKATA